MLGFANWIEIIFCLIMICMWPLVRKLEEKDRENYAGLTVIMFSLLTYGYSGYIFFLKDKPTIVNKMFAVLFAIAGIVSLFLSLVKWELTNWKND